MTQVLCSNQLYSALTLPQVVRQDQLPLFSWDKFGLAARHGADSTLWVGTRNDEHFYTAFRHHEKETFATNLEILSQ